MSEREKWSWLKEPSKTPPINPLEDPKHKEPSVATDGTAHTAEQKEGTEKEERAVMDAHVNQSNEYQDRTKKPDRKFRW